MFTEMGLLSESEFVRLVGATPKDVGAKSVEIKNEEGEKKAMFIISLRGLPLEEMLSIRKIQIAHKVSVDHMEHLLLQERQLTQDQGLIWADSTCKQQIKSRPSAVTFAGRAGLHSLEHYQGKAEEIEEKRRSALGLNANEVEEEDEENDDILDQMDLGEQLALPQHEAVPEGSSAFGSMLSTTATGSVKKKAPKTQKKKGGGTAEDDEEMLEEASSVGGLGNKMLPTEISRVDPEMGPVAKKHYDLTNRTSPSLANLQIKRFLAGEKLGQAINGVGISSDSSVGII